ncbi:hypothetical protein SXCC_00711 [Gluconacetobacter sp. SXCC-1]|nr:hypothetical protein SXCC_00711 [Gluconacetobacter sp. SXCC-1]
MRHAALATCHPLPMCMAQRLPPPGMRVTIRTLHTDRHV